MQINRHQTLKDEILASEVPLIRWICDYQQNTGLNKALRHVKPTKVQVVVNPEYVEYMSKEGHKHYPPQPFTMFVFNKKDEVTKKEIKFFGNHISDNGVYVFNAEKECNEKYNDLIWHQIKSLENEKERIYNTFESQIKQMKEMFVGGSDIVLESLSRDK
ncbi:hypothetical protein D3C81_96540 [compost metagenome]